MNTFGLRRKVNSFWLGRLSFPSIGEIGKALVSIIIETLFPSSDIVSSHKSSIITRPLPNLTTINSGLKIRR